MNLHTTTPYVAEALVRASQQWHKHRMESTSREPEASLPLTIALSREVGARGTSVAREVGKRLNWTVYDHELLEHIAQEMQLRVRLLESVDERRISWLEERVRQLGSGAHVSEASYVRHLVQTVVSLATYGECVIVGRGAAMILPGGSTLRVRLVANLPDRAAVMSQELSISHEEAVRRVQASDRERERFVRDHFQKDPSDVQNYDLVLNSSYFRIDECADLIVEALHCLQRRAANGKSGAA